MAEDDATVASPAKAVKRRLFDRLFPAHGEPRSSDCMAV